MSEETPLINLKTFDEDVDKMADEDVAVEAEKIRAELEGSSISTYEESIENGAPSEDSVVSDDENLLRKIDTKINDIDAQIVIKNETEEVKSKAEIDEILAKKHEKISKNVKNKASLLKKEHDFKYDDEEYRTSNVAYMNIIFGLLLFPEENVVYEKETKNLCSTNTLVRALTLYKNFDVFNAPDEKMLHSLPEIVVIADAVNHIFKYNFMNIHGNVRLNVNEIETNLFKFLELKKDLPSFVFESRVINSIMNKLILILNTNVEFAFRDNTVKADDEFLVAINEDLKNMEKLQSKDGKQYALWRVFSEALCSVRFKKSERMIYRHESYEKLNKILSEIISCYGPGKEDNLLMNELLGNALKCYLPTVIFSYFFMLRSVHIMVRLIAIYIREKLYVGKSRDAMIRDYYHLAAISVVIYENKYNLWKNVIRSPIRLQSSSKELAEKSQLYLYNHIICGGQYFLLKSLEKAIPLIVNVVI